jgi:tetratricopeptide (TPR) repeat protein
MAENRSIFSIISLIVSLMTLVIVVIILLSSPSGSDQYDGSREKRLAGELTDNNLYEAAVEEYKKILKNSELSDESEANISYLIARLYFENIRDYEQAAAFYVRARALNPNGSFYSEAGKNLIACLEKMGHMVDAKRALDRAVDIDSVHAAHKGETMVAKIGEIPVYLSQLENEIQKLPPEAQKQYVGVEGRRKFLSQYIGLELMYRAAVRENYQADPEIVRQKEDLEKQLLISKYINKNVVPTINIDTADVRTFYLAHKSDRYGDKPYEDVQNQLFIDYQQEKAQQAFMEYVSKLASVENVRLFEENIK